MTRKTLILVTAVILTVFGGTVNKAEGQTINLRTCTHMPYQIGSTINIDFNISGSFHHYHAYIRNVNDLSIDVVKMVTDRTSADFSYSWAANSAGNYRVTVVVYDASGNELVNTRTGLNCAPANYNFEVKSLSATTNNASSVTAYSAYLSGSSNATGYMYHGIRYRMTTSNNWTYTYDGSATITGLQPCQRYEFYYWAETCNGQVDGPVRYFDTPTIPSPTNVSALKNGSSVNISWSSVQAGTVYRVYRSSSASGTYSQIGTHTYNTNYTDNSPLCGDNYYKITVQADICESNQSSYAFVNYSAPTAPTSIASSNGTTICLGNSTTLTASGGSIGDGCTYQWYSGSCGNGSVLGTGQSITVSPTSNTTYYVRRTGTSPCNGTTTGCASVTITVNTPPTAPTNITASSNPICSGSSTTLTASGGSIGSGCTYQWGTGTCGSNIVSGQTGSSIIVNPTTTTTYWVRRAGMSPCGSTTTTCATIIINVSTYTITATAGNGGSISPDRTTFVNCGDSKTYTFTPNEGYQINQVMVDGLANLTAQVDGFYTFSNVTENHTIEVTYSNTNSINDVLANQLKIFPNPAQNEIFIKSDLQIEKLEIYSLTGALMIQENNFTEKISISALPQGVYLLKVYTDKGLAVSKVVKE